MHSLAWNNRALISTTSTLLHCRFFAEIFKNESAMAIEIKRQTSTGSKSRDAFGELLLKKALSNF